MQIADLVEITEVEGPGRRAAVWFQGCSIRCPGCCNPEYLEPVGGTLVDPVGLARRLADLPVEGVSILGGEPLDQAAELVRLLEELRGRSDKGVFLFTGHEFGVLGENPVFRKALGLCDMVKAGPFVAGLSPDTRRWIGSRNQTVHFLTSRYRHLENSWEPARREIEVHLSGDGIHINGDPLAWGKLESMFPKGTKGV